MTCLASNIARGCAALMVTGFLTGPVHADSARRSMSDKVQITLRGRIAPRCDLAGVPSTLDLGNLPKTGAQGEKQLKFQLTCNTPFTYQLSSDNGAMRHESLSASSGFAADFPYNAALNILTDGGATLTLDCASAQLGEPVGACAGTSDDQTAIEKQATLTVSWGPLEERLVAGRYSDDLHIAFSVEN